MHGLGTDSDYSYMDLISETSLQYLRSSYPVVCCEGTSEFFLQGPVDSPVHGTLLLAVNKGVQD